MNWLKKNENLLNQNLTTLTCILKPRNRLIVLITYNQKQNTVSLAHQKENVKVHFDYKTSLSLNICPVKIPQKRKKIYGWKRSGLKQHGKLEVFFESNLYVNRSLPCCLSLNVICIHHLVQKKKYFKTEITRRKNPFLRFVISEQEFGQTFTEIKTKGYSKSCLKKELHKEMITWILAEKFKGIHFESCDENVVRGNSVQILPNFPAKSLSIYLNEFFFTLLWLFNWSLIIELRILMWIEQL